MMGSLKICETEKWFLAQLYTHPLVRPVPPGSKGSRRTEKLERWSAERGKGKGQHRSRPIRVNRPTDSACQYEERAGPRRAVRRPTEDQGASAQGEAGAVRADGEGDAESGAWGRLRSGRDRPDRSSLWHESGGPVNRVPTLRAGVDADGWIGRSDGRGIARDGPCGAHGRASASGIGDRCGRPSHPSPAPASRRSHHASPGPVSSRPSPLSQRLVGSHAWRQPSVGTVRPPRKIF